MNWSALIRHTHRWLGVSLVALTIVNAVAFSLGHAVAWLYYLPLVPLFLSMLTGIFLFVRSYFPARRAEGRP